jgi:hypothetical protein
VGSEIGRDVARQAGNVVGVNLKPEPRV